jgi:hypothetical protein
LPVEGDALLEPFSFLFFVDVMTVAENKRSYV